MPLSLSIPDQVAPRPGRSLAPALFVVLCALSLMVTGCGGHKSTARDVPPAPGIESKSTTARNTAPATSAQRPRKPAEAVPASSNAPRVSGGIHVDPRSKVLWRQEGYASWYGPNYHMKKGANGEVYDQNDMTAAHNTLPLGSIVRVTNLKNKQSAVVRITDRGPFVEDRVIDLSMAAAKALDIYLAGTAMVRLEVIEAPRAIETGGRWCVQMGAFQSEDAAVEMKARLQKRYQSAQVLQFKGPTGYWVRVRVEGDDKTRSKQVFEHTKVDEGAVFLVRLD